MATWDTFTVTGLDVKGRSPADFPTLADGAIATTDAVLIEGKRTVRRLLLAPLAGAAVTWTGGTAAFFDAIADQADASEEFAQDLTGAVAAGYRFVAFDGFSMGEGDRWAEKRDAAFRELKEYVAALARIIPSVLVGTPAASAGTRLRGRVKGLDAWV